MFKAYVAAVAGSGVVFTEPTQQNLLAAEAVLFGILYHGAKTVYIVFAPVFVYYPWEVYVGLSFLDKGETTSNSARNVGDDATLSE